MSNDNNGLAVQPRGGEIMETVIAKGDLSQLSPDQRATYYMHVCESMGLNPLTKPFSYILLSGGLTLYATKTATDQLRTSRGISIYRVESETTPDGMRIVTAYARDASGREDMDLGIVNVKGLGGDNLANAMMKALTKAKRRVTLSIAGLGWLDETEVDSIPTARAIDVNVQTGEIVDERPATGRDDDAPIPNGFGVTTRQLRHVHAIKTEKGISDAAIKLMHGLASAKNLTAEHADELIARLNALTPSMVDDLNAKAANPDPDPLDHASDPDVVEVDPETGEILAGQDVTSPELAGMGGRVNPDRWTK